MKTIRLVIVALILLTTTEVYSQVANFELVKVETNSDSISTDLVNPEFREILNYKYVTLKTRRNGVTKWAKFYPMFTKTRRSDSALFAKFKGTTNKTEEKSVETLIVNYRKDVEVTIITNKITWNTSIRFYNKSINEYLILVYQMI